MRRQLEILAERHGILPSYPSAEGDVLVPDRSRLTFLQAMGVDLQGATGTELPPEIEAAPLSARCYFPDWLREKKAWGIAAQLYELRSRRNWGIGDFADLAELCELAAGVGADFVGLNPLHTLFLAEPERCSPFSPSNRQFLNPLYIAVDRVDGFDPHLVDSEEVGRLREADFVDYPRVARLKIATLRRMWEDGAGTDRDALATFKQQGGTALYRHALFEALSFHMKAAGHGSGWNSWPGDHAAPDAPAVKRFETENAGAVEFQIWLQWLARKQLAEAAERARAAGMRIGLYLDFAVGEAPDGSAAWSNPALAVAGVKIGAPPDVFSANGQDWGLAPLSPAKLADNDFQPYRSLMEAAMRDAGALRIDHAMSLRRLFWIPADGSPAEGGFVLYPMEGLLAALADLSEQHRTLVVGEDLGHVPEGFRESMAAAQILSYRILYFEREGSRFRPARSWPKLALACLSTHDLPTLKGWWQGSDVALRLEHGLIDAELAATQKQARKAERRELLRSFSANAGTGRDEARSLAGSEQMLDEASFEALAVAAHRFISRTPSCLACMRLADAVGEEHPTNLPGTSDAYPNWRRRLPVALERLSTLPLFRAVTAAMAKERPR